MTPFLRRPLAASALAVFGLFAMLEQPLASRRPMGLDLGARVRVLVTSPRDTGPGSLREALLAAARAKGRARIAIRVPRVALETPLPPLVNGDGIVLEGADGGTEIDARGAPAAAVLDVAAPGSSIRGLTIRGATGAGILVRAAGTSLQEVTLTDCEEGAHLTEGTGGLLVEGSTFADNGTGLRVEAGAASVVVNDSRFERHAQAAVWAVSPKPAATGPAVSVRHSRFRDDRISVVLVNVAAEVEHNDFAGAQTAALYVTGAATVRHNRFRGGAGIGVLADASDAAIIEDNELDHNAAVGLILRHARATEVRRNRIYANGFGVAVVFGDAARPNLLADNLVLSQGEDGLYVVGGAPVLRANHSLSNRRAGLRVLDYVPRRGARVVARPVLQENVFARNGADAPQHEIFFEPADSEGGR